ncbi:hypothetical protein CLAIMM_02688 [Cladophialophora immunda]|nr:hypothetical protein CLAIMM_02688 [Cladophialophora immunda]
MDTSTNAKAEQKHGEARVELILLVVGGGCEKVSAEVRNSRDANCWGCVAAQFAVRMPQAAGSLTSSAAWWAPFGLMAPDCAQGFAMEYHGKGEQHTTRTFKFHFIIQ